MRAMLVPGIVLAAACLHAAELAVPFTADLIDIQPDGASLVVQPVTEEYVRAAATNDTDFGERPVTVLLFGVDTAGLPDARRRDASTLLHRLLSDELLNEKPAKELSIVPMPAGEPPGRLRAIVRWRNADLSEYLIEHGAAFRTNDAGMYATAERRAKERHLGVWSIPDRSEYKEYSDQQKQIGGYYRITLSGADNSRRLRGDPPRYLVTKYTEASQMPWRFVLIAVDPKIVTELHPSEDRVVNVQLEGYVRYVSPERTTNEIPVVRVVGRTRVLGVIGDLMYYK